MELPELVVVDQVVSKLIFSNDGSIIIIPMTTNSGRGSQTIVFNPRIYLIKTPFGSKLILNESNEIHMRWNFSDTNPTNTDGSDNKLDINGIRLYILLHAWLTMNHNKRINLRKLFEDYTQLANRPVRDYPSVTFNYSRP
jgi:hypothetical protein